YTKHAPLFIVPDDVHSSRTKQRAFLAYLLEDVLAGEDPLKTNVLRSPEATLKHVKHCVQTTVKQATISKGYATAIFNARRVIATMDSVRRLAGATHNLTTIDEAARTAAPGSQ